MLPDVMTKKVRMSFSSIYMVTYSQNWQLPPQSPKKQKKIDLQKKFLRYIYSQTQTLYDDNITTQVIMHNKEYQITGTIGNTVTSGPLILHKWMKLTCILFKCIIYYSWA